MPRFCPELLENNLVAITLQSYEHLKHKKPRHHLLRIVKIVQVAHPERIIISPKEKFISKYNPQESDGGIAALSAYNQDLLAAAQSYPGTKLCLESADNHTYPITHDAFITSLAKMILMTTMVLHNKHQDHPLLKLSPLRITPHGYVEFFPSEEFSKSYLMGMTSAEQAYTEYLEDILTACRNHPR